MQDQIRDNEDLYLRASLAVQLHVQRKLLRRSCCANLGLLTCTRWQLMRCASCLQDAEVHEFSNSPLCLRVFAQPMARRQQAESALRKHEWAPQSMATGPCRCHCLVCLQRPTGASCLLDSGHQP